MVVLPKDESNSSSLWLPARVSGGGFRVYKENATEAGIL